MLDGTSSAPTAHAIMRSIYSRTMQHARAEYHDCRSKGLRIMTDHYRREMVRCYLTLRSLRGL